MPTESSAKSEKFAYLLNNGIQAYFSHNDSRDYL